MKFNSVSKFAITLLIVFLSKPVAGADAPLSVEEVASILGYPADVTVEDVTEDSNRQAARKGRPSWISAHIFRGDPKTFAHLSIGIANEGILLTDEVKVRFSQAIEGMQKAVGTNLHFKWLSFDDVGYGVTGLGMTGGGGSEQKSLLTVIGKMDVQVSVSTGEDPLEVLPGAEDYHRLIREGGINEKLVECLSLVASKVAGRPIKAVASDVLPKLLETPASRTNPSQPKTPLPPSKNEPRISEQTVDSTANSEPAMPAAIEQTSPNRARLKWGIGMLVIFAFLAWLALKRRAS